MKFIIYHSVGKTKWYVTKIEYSSDEPYMKASDWVLHIVQSWDKKKAVILLNREKAEKVAEILSCQFDEFGYSEEYKVEVIK